jgi:hypothetical protein
MCKVVTPVMRIRIIQKPAVASIDGIQLDFFEVGFKYDVGNTLGSLLLAEGWAEPIAEPDEGASPPASRGRVQPPADPDNPPNLRREIYPPVFRPFDTAAADEKLQPPGRDHGRPTRPKRVPPRRFRR